MTTLNVATNPREVRFSVSQEIRSELYRLWNAGCINNTQQAMLNALIEQREGHVLTVHYDETGTFLHAVLETCSLRLTTL